MRRVAHRSLSPLMSLRSAESVASDDSETKTPVRVEDAYIDGNAQVGGNIDERYVLLTVLREAPNSQPG